MYKTELSWKEVLANFAFCLLAFIIAGLVVMGDYIADWILQYIH